MKLLEMREIGMVNHNVPERNVKKNLHSYLKKTPTEYYWKKRSENAILASDLCRALIASGLRRARSTQQAHVVTSLREKWFLAPRIATECKKCHSFHSYCIKNSKYLKERLEILKRYINGKEPA
jgi:hypothetical protein